LHCPAILIRALDRRNLENIVWERARIALTESEKVGELDPENGTRESGSKETLRCPKGRINGVCARKISDVVVAPWIRFVQDV